ncbi:MAG: PIN domain nuclease [Planctomycetota bacterium]|jgi:predicted nucleic acid-binding protein|nr:PIN domain nuclease [Planctomycetota bacterium]
MKKMRLYLETSVISQLNAPDRPDWMAETLRLWKELEADRYEAIVGEPVVAEIKKCYEPKRTFMLDKVKEMVKTMVGETDEAKRIANEYIRQGGLKRKSATDALHIALATLANCDFVVSWNCRHIVNVNAMSAVEAVNFREGFRLIKLVTPTIFMEGQSDEF